MDREELKANMEDCTYAMCKDIKSADHFILGPDDCDNAQEYVKILTAAQLVTCFKRALKAAK